MNKIEDKTIYIIRYVLFLAIGLSSLFLGLTFATSELADIPKVGMILIGLSFIFFGLWLIFILIKRILEEKEDESNVGGFL